MSLAEITGMSEIERVSRMVARATDELRAVERRAHKAFAEWLKVQAEADKLGLVVDVKLDPGIAAALASFKSDMAAETGRIVAHEDEHGWEPLLGNGGAAS